MMGIRGTIRNRGYGGTGAGLVHVRQDEDLRPREVFEVGDHVCCPGVTGKEDGVILAFDVDHRLAKVRWPWVVEGWWYLKDLAVVKRARKEAGVAPVKPTGVATPAKSAGSQRQA